MAYPDVNLSPDPGKAHIHSERKWINIDGEVYILPTQERTFKILIATIVACLGIGFALGLFLGLFL